MNKIFKLSLTLFVIVAGTLLLLAGAGGVRYVGNFTGNGAGLTNIPQAGVVQLSNSLYYLTNSIVASAGTNLPNLTVTNSARLTNVLTAGLTNFGTARVVGDLLANRIVQTDGAASNHIAGDMTLVGDMTIGGSNYVAGDMGIFGTLFVDGVSASGTIFTSDIFEGNGSGITNLSGDEIRSGTVADARIASTIARDSEVTTATQNSTNAGNIAFLPADNVFTGTSNHFNGAIGAAGFYGDGGGLTNITATSTNLFSFTNMIWVTDFGAGTNVANNSDPINLAIQAATNHINDGWGGTVFIPPGYFACTNTILLYPGITLKGAGREATVLFFTSAVSNMIEYVPNGLAGSWVVGVKDLYLRASLATTNTGAAVFIVGGNDPYFVSPDIRNIHIYASVTNGIHLQDCINAQVENCLISHGYGSGMILMGNAMTIRNCYMEYNSEYGYKLDGGYNSLLSCAADHNGQGGYFIGNMIGSAAAGLALWGCGAEQNGVYQYYIKDAQDVSLISCTAWQALTVTNSGIGIENVDGVLIENCNLGAQPNATNSGYAVEFVDASNHGVQILSENMYSYGLGVLSTTNQCEVYSDLDNQIDWRMDGYFRRHLNVTSNLSVGGTFSVGTLIVTNPPVLDLQSSTNLFEKNVVVQTNSWGNQVVDFSRGTLLHTNLAGDLTLTGISNFALSNYNWMTVELNPNGSTRVLTVPADWYVNIGTTITNGFTNATMGAIPDGTWAQLQLSAIIGVRTAAVLNILQ